MGRENGGVNVAFPAGGGTILEDFGRVSDAADDFLFQRGIGRHCLVAGLGEGGKMFRACDGAHPRAEVLRAYCQSADRVEVVVYVARGHGMEFAVCGIRLAVLEEALARQFVARADDRSDVGEQGQRSGSLRQILNEVAPRGAAGRGRFWALVAGG